MEFLNLKMLPTASGSQQLGVRQRETDPPRPQHGLGQQSVLDRFPGNICACATKEPWFNC